MQAEVIGDWGEGPRVHTHGSQLGFLVPHGSWSLALLPRKRVAEEEPSTSAAVPVAKKKPGRGFGDFSSW